MNKLQITLLSLLGIVTACTNDTDENITGNTGRAVIVQGSIGTAQVERAATGEGGISYKNDFAKDDEIGLFATDGLTASNEKLIHDGSVFKKEELNWTGDNASAVWAYFPYSENTATKANEIKINIWKKANGTIPASFEDILVAKPGDINEGIIIDATFDHRFALLCVKRGKGFSKAEAHKAVKVSLTQSISSNATINYNNGKDFVALDKDDDTNTGHKELETNATNDSYYAIIPVGKVSDGDFLNIESITLYNDLDRKMTVPYNIKSLASGKIFTVTVIMRDNEAVVSPTEIVQWDNENVNIEKPAGIETAEQFKDWVGAYNSPGEDESAEILEACGSPSTDGKWTFRLLNDITLTEETNTSGITSFSDIFDGQGHTITNINIHEEESGTSPAGFVRTLTGKGSIERLILKDAVIYGNDNVGGFAGTAESGSTIKDCKLTGASIIFGKSKVDAFVGNDGGATVKNCTYSPTVIVKKATN